MQAKETIIRLPLDRGWVEVARVREPAVQPEIGPPPSGALLLHDVELAYATCRALNASEMELGGALDVLALSKRANQAEDLMTAGQKSTMPDEVLPKALELEKVSRLSRKAGQILFERKLLDGEKGARWLARKFKRVVVKALEYTDPAATGAWAPQPTGKSNDAGEAYETTAQREGSYVVACEGPARLAAEKKSISQIKDHPTRFEADEAAMALDAINHKLADVYKDGDVAEQISLLASAQWVLKNTITTQITASSKRQWRSWVSRANRWYSASTRAKTALQ